MTQSTQSTQAEAIRSCGRELREIVDGADGDPTRALPEFVAVVQRLLDQKDLLDVGMPRHGVHVSKSRVLFYEPELIIFSGSHHVPWTVEAHNHGAWVATALYAGTITQQSYRSVHQDDGGVARLEVVEDMELQPGDVCVCPPPPHDIHALTSSTGSDMLVIAGGTFSDLRRYYHVDSGTYEERLGA
ncbi:MAG TPA: hypothetical protein VK537_04150 [Galbitalea sp.]|nr:hypothetical protein [Galbitalea sp.]